MKDNVMEMFYLLVASLNFPFQVYVANYKPDTNSFILWTVSTKENISSFKQ